ncbi:MAG: hypothetical protein IPO78_16535 [Saprospiraceae bacterium]|nr:hypothetical protein [Saprospiraceae bacterium]
METLHEEVNQIWKSVDDPVDEFNTDLAFEIEAVFEWLEDNDYSYKDAYNEFIDYAKEHKHLFDTETQSKIRHTCNGIASVFKSINHKEENLLHKLDDFLNTL